MITTEEVVKCTTNNNPVVTFAIFAWNQEEFIREAIEGAFSQTYELLEIILSDDCSTDNTFKIMQEMAAGYQGAHKVLLRQNKKNLGLADHINEVVKNSHGEVIVVAAGDDVSMPARTEAIVSIFKKHPDTAAVFSSYETIPVGGDDSRYGIANELVTRIETIISGGGVQIGATYAYKRECFFWPTPIPSWVISEDRVLPLRSTLLGSLRYTEQKLIKYRLASTLDETAKKNTRTLGYNHPSHFNLLFKHIELAGKEKKIGKLTVLYLRILLFYTRKAVRLQSRDGSVRYIGSFIFIPLRIARKVSVALVSLKLK